MENLRLLRKKHGLTQVQLAEILNISQSTLWGYETGKHEPDNTTLQKISNYFKVSIDYLFGRESDFENNVIQGTEEPFFTTPQEQEFIIKLRSLSSSTQAMILRVLDNAVQAEKRA